MQQLKAIEHDLGVAIGRLNGIYLTELEDALGRLHDWIEGQEGKVEYTVRECDYQGAPY